jgi:hypothetical protein
MAAKFLISSGTFCFMSFDVFAWIWAGYYNDGIS